MDNEKIKIFLAGDSTMQWYSDEKRPQYGWGEVFYNFIDDVFISFYKREDTPFEQQKCFETINYIVDNCAMAGRSLKSFTDEERHIDILNNINKNDYLIVQFGHNDISTEKPERYVPIKKLNEYFKIFIDIANEKEAKLIILSPILIDIYTNNDRTLKFMVDELKKYISEIEKIALDNNITFVNVGGLAKNKINYNFEKLDKFYLEDHVHLTKKGAEFYAKIIADGINVLNSKNH